MNFRWIYCRLLIYPIKWRSFNRPRKDGYLIVNSIFKINYNPSQSPFTFILSTAPLSVNNPVKVFLSEVTLKCNIVGRPLAHCDAFISSRGHGVNIFPIPLLGSPGTTHICAHNARRHLQTTTHTSRIRNKFSNAVDRQQFVLFAKYKKWPFSLSLCLS